jgi:hypothetical protein
MVLAENLDRRSLQPIYPTLTNPQQFVDEAYRSGEFALIR